MADDSVGYWQSTQSQWHNLAKVFDIEVQVNQKIEQLDKQFQSVRTYNQNHQVVAMGCVADVIQVDVLSDIYETSFKVVEIEGKRMSLYHT